MTNTSSVPAAPIATATTSPVDGALGAPPERTRAAWAGVVSIGLAIFTMVASEFLPASLLSPIAADLGLTEGAAGQLVTATSLAGIVGGPLVVAVVPRVDRRLVVMGLTALAVLSNVLVAVVPSFGGMLAARLLLGLAISGTWALSLAVTAQLVPADRIGRAMTIVNTGMTLATIAAVPAGAYLGEVLGWRAVFLLAAAAAVVALIFQAVTLPSVTPTGAPGVRSLLQTAVRPVVALGVLAIVLLAGGHFMGFTYLRPAFESIVGMSPALLAGLLVVFGVASFIGNLVAGPIADRRLGVLLFAVPFAIGVGTATLALSGSGLWLVAVSVFVWGVGFGAVPTTVQAWIARVAPDRLESAGGLVVSAFQIAIAAGAAVGGLIVDSAGVQAALIAGGISAVAGGVVLMLAGRR
ncbi:MFS transporter [Agromyces intestinalis]|uniref:MFS transporter n=1 Tax=Agromyces intestinalis TaxID=2592652 RepID=A0A5C1YFC8_9MICO|nr:MFS transporter [Agromyces intestinalis]QEO14255.1 MFS transporter [Agromyces intestinalis]